MEKSIFRASWLWVIFTASMLIAVVHFVGQDYWSMKVIHGIEFWIAILAIAFLLMAIDLDINSHVLLIVIYFGGLILAYISLANMFHHYVTAPFWSHTLNLNGLIAGLLIMFIMLRLTPPINLHNLYKRRNHLLDELETEEP